MVAAGDGSEKTHRVTIACPGKLTSYCLESGIYWLVGSPRFLPPVTIVSALRCLHWQGDDRHSPEYDLEADDLRTLLIRGFVVVGALFVENNNQEENARRAVGAATVLKKKLFNDDVDGDVIVGAAGNLATKEIQFFASEAGRSSTLKPFESVVFANEANPEKYVWENGCLLRCQLEFKLPVFVPQERMSDMEKMQSSIIDGVACKLRDPNVAFIVEGSNTKQLSILLHGSELKLNDDQLGSSSLVDKFMESEKTSLPCSHFLLSNEADPSLILRESADTIRVSILYNTSGNAHNLHAPTAEYFPASLSPRLAAVNYKLDVLCYSSKDFPISSAVSRLIYPGLMDQLTRMTHAITPKILSEHPQLCPYHFFPPGILHPITAIYELQYGETEMIQVGIRRSLHLRLGLPLDRPLLLVANAVNSGTERIKGSAKHGSVIKDVHIGIPRSAVSGGIVSLVDGSYEYYHYLQDGFDDSGWGCAYRSLQTIVSWFKLQHYTSLQVPSHREIQQTLVEIGDKEPYFVGSREWIGAIEISFVLDKLLGVSCKIINVRSGAELPEKCRELAQHFETQGTPVMIGGGVLAYTLLGVDHSEASGDCAFLILDPHYTGSDDHKKIMNGGWCGWKKPVDSKGKNFFLHDKFYNLLLPQRPNMV